MAGAGGWWDRAWVPAAGAARVALRGGLRQAGQLRVGDVGVEMFPASPFPQQRFSTAHACAAGARGLLGLLACQILSSCISEQRLLKEESHIPA